MNYLYSAFFCPPCQSLHDMYVYACMYIYDIWYMYIYECADDCNKLSSIITSYYVCEKESDRKSLSEAGRWSRWVLCVAGCSSACYYKQGALSAT